MNAKGYTFCDGVDERDVLRYGEYVIDKEYITWDNHNYRVRAIRYNDKLYWHEMVDGKVIDFRGLR